MGAALAQRFSEPDHDTWIVSVKAKVDEIVAGWISTVVADDSD